MPGRKDIEPSRPSDMDVKLDSPEDFFSKALHTGKVPDIPTLLKRRLRPGSSGQRCRAFSLGRQARPDSIGVLNML